MRKYNFGIIGAVFTALLSTLCCLPALLFIFFGISSGVLTYFTTLEFLRIPMTALTIILFILGIKSLNKKISCECSRKDRIKQYSFLSAIFLFIVFLLLYPEIIPYFMD